MLKNSSLLKRFTQSLQKHYYIKQISMLPQFLKASFCFKTELKLKDKRRQ